MKTQDIIKKSIWNDQEDSLDTQSSEEVYKSFITLSEYFQPRPKHIEQDIPSPIKEINSDLLNKKKIRQDSIDIEEQSLTDFAGNIGPEPVNIDLDDKLFYSNGNMKEMELFSKYVQQGKRIPRRGEVGYTPEEIQKYESLGYVMKRNTKMENARIKRESIVYSAEEKRALALYKLHEQKKKDTDVINAFKLMLNNNQQNKSNNNDSI